MKKNISNWHWMLFSALWECHILSNIVIEFNNFQLVYREEVIFHIECEIPSLKLYIELLPKISIEESRLLHFIILMKLKGIPP